LFVGEYIQNSSYQLRLLKQQLVHHHSKLLSANASAKALSRLGYVRKIAKCFSITETHQLSASA